jgi:hypothetical protein
VEISTYGLELVASRIAMELILDVRYMLRSLGVALNGPALMLADNMSVFLNTTVPSSFLTKKHNAIVYYQIVCDLSKCMNAASWGSDQELLPVIKFIDDTKSFGLKVMPKFDNGFSLNLKAFCDSDWAGNPETRVSVTGFVIYLFDVPVCWRSKSQKGVTLSSTEAEYVAISEAVKEVKFIYYLLCDFHIKVNLPIIIKTDNIVAIFMAEN